MNKSKYIVEVLKQYADEQGIIVRSTSDLSPLEAWLLNKLFVIVDQSYKNIGWNQHSV